MARNHDSFPLRLATIRSGDRGNATNKTMEWSKLRDRLGKPVVDQDTTVEHYKRLPPDKKNRLKDVGSFVGGPFKDGKRRANNIVERSIITLDLDAISPGQVETLKLGLSGLGQYEFFGSTTRSHTADSPRWRLVVPTSRTVSAEEYAPLARILASKLFDSVSESMDATDDVSFRVAQIMYWPSVCSDGEFDTIHNKGELVDPDAVLQAFGNWQDWTLLPYSEKRGQKRPTIGKKAENPREKRGIVGAFCRAYDVPAAIAKFIPTVYVIGDKQGKKQRYTYAAGSGANGAVIEDGGLFLYSHHGTDPCGERLVNAWDMVRLHLFGAEDLEAGDDVGPTQMPSFKAMEEFLSDDLPTITELRKEQYDVDAIFEDSADEEPKEEDPFDDILGDATEPTKASTDWMNELELDGKGLIKPTLTNLALIVQNDPRMAGVVEANDFVQEVVTRKPLKTNMSIIPTMPIDDTVNGDLWSDRHDGCIRALIEAPHGKGKPGYGLKVTDRDLKGAIDLAAAKRAFHPVRDYLKGLTWDGKPRMDTLFVRYLGAPNTPYTRAIARLMMIGGVTRVFEPGHKFDFVTILEGLQGKRKSTFIKILARNWFVELEGDLHDRKQLVEKMQGAWILEIPELSGFGKAEIQAIKALFSATTDKTRLSYDRRAKVFKRQCIFIGSTNDAEYLRDPTGGRRFWPVTCQVDEIRTEELETEVDQLWAEAYTAYRAMRKAQPVGTLPLYLSDEEAKAESLALQESRRVETAEDAYAGMIGEWLDTPVADNRFKDADDLDDGSTLYRRNETCLLQIWVECLERPRDQYSEGVARMLGRAMKLLKDWETLPTARKHEKYGSQKTYRRKGFTGAALEPVTTKGDFDDLGV